MKKQLFLAVLFSAATLQAAPTLTGGNVSGAAGSDVDLVITFNPTPNNVAGMQFSLTLPVAVSTVSVTAGAAATSAAKSVADSRVGNSWNIIVFGLNTNSINSGIIATTRMHIASNASVGALSIPITNVVYVDANGATITAGPTTNGAITVTAAGSPPPPPPPPTTSAPAINSAATASGTVGTLFSYQITASNSPTSFNAVGLPTGLSINTTSGLISGTPASAGTSNITLSATNASGTGTQGLTLTVSPASATSPSLGGGSAAGPSGGTVTFPVTFFSGSTSVAGVSFRVLLPSGWSFVSFSTGPASQSAGKTVSGNSTTGAVLVVGFNATPLSAGVVANIVIQIPPGTSNGTYPITLNSAVYVDAAGGAVTGTTPTNGSVLVNGSVGGTLPDPILNLASILPVNAEIQLANASSYSGANFTWNVTPVPNSIIGFSGTRALGAPQPVSTTSGVPRFSLGTFDLTPGMYIISIQVSAGNQTSAVVSATVSLVPTGLDAVVVYPNPWRSDRHAGRDIKIDQLSAGAEVKIFTISGHTVRTLVPGIPADSVTWDRKNDSGDTVASGIYIYLIKDSSGAKKTGKLVIIK